MQSMESSSNDILFELEQNISALDKNTIDEICQAVLVGEPENSKAHKILFDAAVRVGDLEEAEKHAVNWIAIADGFEPRFSLGLLFSKAGRDYEAIEQFQFALRESNGEEPELFETFKNMGNSYVRTLDFQSAEELYNRAFAINPNSDVLEVNYGTLFIQMNRFIEAVERFKNAISINPLNEKSWLGLGMSYRGMHEFDLAYANVIKALEINGLSAIASQLLFDWSFQDNRFESLTQFLGKKIKLKSCTADVLQLARVYIYQHHWVLAIEVLSKAIGSAYNEAEKSEIDQLLQFSREQLKQV